MHRALWSPSYLEANPPRWPCPTCGRETLQPDGSTFALRAASGYNFSELTPDEYSYRFTQFFQCSVVECGEVVGVLGTAHLELNQYGTSHDDAYLCRLYPAAMHHAPPIVQVPPATPDSVRSEIEVSFSLFWIDLGACANRIRISVERILDELGIPGGRPLNDRIRAFEAIDPSHAETFHALREVGNVGSHEGNSSRETVLDAFEIFEDALRNLFGDQKERIDALRKKIRASKGR